MLSEALVRKLRRSYKRDENFSIKEQAKIYGVDEQAIRRAVLNQSFKNSDYKPPRKRRCQEPKFDKVFALQLRKNREFSIQKIAELEAAFSKRSKPYSYARVRELLREAEKELEQYPKLRS